MPGSHINNSEFDVNGYDPDAVSRYSRNRYGSAARNGAYEQAPAYDQMREPAYDQPYHDVDYNAGSSSYDSYGNTYDAPGNTTSFDPVSGDASAYSRYSNDANSVRSGAHARMTTEDIYPELARMKKRKKKSRKVLRVLVGVLLACVLGGAAYGIWFTNALDRALAPDDKTAGELASVLVPQVDGKPYYVLVMGSDSREGNYTEQADQQGFNERSDVMMLVRIDGKHKQITLLSIPRDTPYRLEDGSYIKINEMFNVDGAAGAVKAVTDLTGLPISHHASIRVSGLEGIVDALGGITVDVPTDLTYTTTDNKEVTIEAGRQKLNGEEAQIFTRARHEYDGNQDERRQDSVRQMLMAIINEILSRPVNEIPGLVLKLAAYVDTDYKALDAVGLAMSFAGSDLNIYTATGPTAGDIDEAAGSKWLCYLNPDGWQKVVAQVDSGEKPTDIDYTETETMWYDVLDQPEFDHSLAHLYYYGNRYNENDVLVTWNDEPV